MTAMVWGCSIVEVVIIYMGLTMTLTILLKFLSIIISSWFISSTKVASDNKKS